ncbi:hypothetical protein GGS26DRAFT_1875 [Hypomontagnella submonticulosa]|nr:hypothetical protein GGS26DRAFT_1875 [Hypomontagnella submonticulosa]
MTASNFRPLPKGIYTPFPTFFTSTGELDLTAFAAHVKFTALAGTIPVVAGSAGEAAHLSSWERTTLIQTARQTLDSCGLDRVPIVAGVGAPSTWETIQLAGLAKKASANYGMIIPPGYYAGTLQADGGEALRKFFVDVAEASPLPIVVYNFPGVSGGIDLGSDLIIDVIKASSNVIGVELICASVGWKITRINAIVSSVELKEKYPRKYPEIEFRIIDGYIDILLPSIASGVAGYLGNLWVTKSCTENMREALGIGQLDTGNSRI